MTSTRIGTETPAASVEQTTYTACITYLLHPHDFVIEAITTSRGYAAPTAPIGQPLTTQLPYAREILTPLLTEVATTRLPAAALLPVAVDEMMTTRCVCTAICDEAGAIKQIACTLIYNDVFREAPLADVNATSARISQAITPATPLHIILDLVIDEAHQLLNAAATQIALNTMMMPGELRCEIGRGAGHAMLAGMPLTPHSLAGQVQRTNRVQRRSGAALALAIRQGQGDAWLRQLDVGSWLGVPLRIGGHVTGIIMVQRDRDSAPFEEADETRLQHLADGVSVLIAEARLRADTADHAQREAVLGRLLDNLPVGVLWIDTEMRVLYTNQVQQERMPQRMGDTLAIGPGEFHPTWRDAATQAPYRWEELPYIRTIRSGHSIEALVLDTATTGSDDAEFIVKTHPLHDAQGNVTDVISVWIDVTEQRRASREAISRAAELDIIIESIADGVIIYNREGAPLRYNAAALEILGWNAAAIDPVSITAAERFDTYDLRFTTGELVPPEERPVTRALAGEITAPIQLVSRRADEAEVVKSIRAAPLHEPTTGAIQGAVIVFRDVTELQRIEQMKEDFINIASHELRAPLEPLMLASGFIKRWIERPERARDVVRLAGEIVTHTRRVSRLVAEMLDMSRVTSGHFAITAEPSNLTRTILDAIDEQQAICHRTITTTGLDRPLFCMADSERIWQVIINLLANAIKYSTAPTSIEVQAQVIPPSETGEVAHMQVMVRDHGTGIAREHLPYIFSRFYRIMRPEPSQSGAQMRDGLGLGLYISRAIIDAHNGQIWAESEPGMGSSFYIELPMCDAPASET